MVWAIRLLTGQYVQTVGKTFLEVGKKNYSCCNSVTVFKLQLSRGFAAAFTLRAPLARCSNYTAALERQLCRWMTRARMRTTQCPFANAEHDTGGQAQAQAGRAKSKKSGQKCSRIGGKGNSIIKPM